MLRHGLRLALASLFVAQAGCGARPDLGDPTPTPTGASTGTGTTTTGAPLPEPCPDLDTYVRLSVSGAPAIELRASCDWWSSGLGVGSGPFAFETTKGVPAVAIAGCASMEPWAQGVLVYGFGLPLLGGHEEVLSNYIDEAGSLHAYDGTPSSMDVTTYEPVGGLVEGTFTTAVVAGQGEELPIAGEFRVCHVAWVEAP